MYSNQVNGVGVLITVTLQFSLSALSKYQSDSGTITMESRLHAKLQNVIKLKGSYPSMVTNVCIGSLYSVFSLSYDLCQGSGTSTENCANRERYYMRLACKSN